MSITAANSDGTTSRIVPSILLAGSVIAAICNALSDEIRTGNRIST